MKSLRLSILIFLMGLMVMSCNKGEDISTINCDQFKTAVISNNNETLKAEIAKLVTDLSPAPTAADVIGQGKNIGILINRINECDKVSAELNCYACIKTYPAQSEILIQADSSGVIIHRIIDITTPEAGKLTFAGIHEAYSL